MTQDGKPGVRLVFYRTLFSQSAASVTMGSLAAYLRGKGVETELSLLNMDGTEKRLKPTWTDKSYRIIIAKPNFKDFQLMFPLLEETKKRKLAERVFLCGPFASLNSEDMMKRHRWIDGIILGYPEETAAELVGSMDGALRWNLECKGGLWRNPRNGKLIFSGYRMSIVPLERLPFPARDIEKREKTSYANIEASRGCLFRCSFCHVGPYHCLVSTAERQTKSPKRVVDEIEAIHRQFGKTLFIFNDPIFWTSRAEDRRVLEICREIEKRKLRIKMYIYLRCDPFPREKVISALAKAGLVRVFLGVENASAETLGRYNKMITPNMAGKAISMLRKRGINIHLGYILFEPFSTMADVKKNVDYLFRLGKLFRIGVLIEPPRIIPGSSLRKKLVENGLMKASLPYERIMYGYRFKDKAVSRMFSAVKLIFDDTLKDEGYELEYYCVSSRLLMDLALKEEKNKARMIRFGYRKLSELSGEANRLIRDMLYLMMRDSENGIEEGKIIRSREMDRMISEFRRLNALLREEWVSYSEEIERLCGRKVIGELYRGVEEI